MTREREVEILKKDKWLTTKECIVYLERGTTIYEDFEERFDSYMTDWGIVEDDDNFYFIEYCL